MQSMKKHIFLINKMTKKKKRKDNDNDGDGNDDDNDNQLKMKICGICLDELQIDQMYSMILCSCTFCKQCLDGYFRFMIDNGHQQIFCPSYKCLSKQSISIDEIKIIITNEQYREKIHTLFTKNQNIDSKLNNDEQENQQQLQCPFCQHLIDNDKDNDDDNMKSHLFQRKIKKENNIDKNNNEIDNEIVVVEQQKSIRIVKCPSCSKIYCSSCSSKLSDENSQHDCRELNNSILNEFDIKRCPNCHYLIQREGGCAQISCRNCCHVFCWHCQQSLDNDFLLFHYDSGPCKNKLGHSRLSIFLNRTQTISICIGISILMLLASPVILALLPCVLTKKCHLYNCCCCCFHRHHHHNRSHRRRHRHNRNYQSQMQTQQNSEKSSSLSSSSSISSSS
uniref:RBR-type E3 ubiquitin transferase n=1 Tax=Dermatophagoides pteronyssinus TaxID=6956 RepID=A0A6P6XNC1_DERPT|nr:probable E3 ubiquitin-protein ligase RNF144A-A [Dermatophagoides pteronyssinus]